MTDYFTPKTWDNPGTALNDLESRVDSGLTAAQSDIATVQASLTALQAQVNSLPASRTIQTVRTAGPAMTASSTVDVSVAWPVAFADTSYDAHVELQESISTGSNGVVVRQIRAKSTTGITVRVSNGTQVFAAGDVTVIATGIHD